MTPSRIAIFTICSNNYMPMARALIESASRFHPQADLFVCLADEQVDIDGLYDVDAEIVAISALQIPHVRSFAFRYDVMELNTAAKPFMFLYLMEERGYEIILYFDPDIELHAKVQAALAPLEAGANFVLTPHVLHPSEETDEPNDVSFMKAGAYNLGFLGTRASEETRSILHWWARQLLFNCVNSQPTGLFVDQKFMDLVPSFDSRVAILRDPSLNVAYWNLTQRRLERDGVGWTVDGQPLVFFHYSGFDAGNPSRLSKYTRRFNNNLEKPLAELLDAYANRLRTLGLGHVADSAYAFGRFASGVPVPDVVRRMYRQRHPGWPLDPFATFEAQLHRPSPDVPQTSSTVVVTNLLKYLHETIAYLQNSVDIETEAGQRKLVDWFVKHAMRELRLDPRLVEPVSLRFGQALPTTATQGGTRQSNVDLSLVIRESDSNAREASRQIKRSLDAAGFSMQHHADPLDVALDRSESSHSNIRLMPMTNSCSSAKPSQAPREAETTTYTIALLAADLASLSPAGWTTLEQADELWAPNRHLQLVTAQRFAKPTVYIPLPLQTPATSDRGRCSFALPPDRFLFLQVVNGPSSIWHANPAGAIEAFCRAFPDTLPSRPGLVICMTNADHAPDAIAELQAARDNDAGVYVVSEELQRADLAALISLCDATLSLHRAEDVGSFVADAMLLGRAVIATDYAATADWVTPTTGFPVDCRLTRATSPTLPLAQGLVWAEPDLDHAAWLMRRIAGDPGHAFPRIARARDYLARDFNLDRVAARQAARLREINVSA